MSLPTLECYGAVPAPDSLSYGVSLGVSHSFRGASHVRRLPGASYTFIFLLLLVIFILLIFLLFPFPASSLSSVIRRLLRG